MSYKILVTGYPGTGKTSLCYRLQKELLAKDIKAEYYNEDIVSRENFLWVKTYNDEKETWEKIINKSLAAVIIIDTIRYNIVAPLIKPNYIIFLNYKTSLTDYLLIKKDHGEISVPNNYNMKIDNIKDIKNVCNYILKKNFTKK